MKNLNFNKIWGGAVLFAFACLFVAFAFDRPASQTYVFEDENGAVSEFSYLPPKSYQKTFTHDTLTNTEKDTLVIPWILASPYQYSIQFKVAKISGNANNNFKAVLDQANTTGSTLWMAIDSFTRTGADSLRRDWLIKGTHTYGARLRLRLIGAGTSSTQYDVSVNIKPPNQ